MESEPQRESVRFAARFGDEFGLRLRRQARQHHLVAHQPRDISAKAHLKLRLAGNRLCRCAERAFKIIEGRGGHCGVLLIKLAHKVKHMPLYLGDFAGFK